MKQPSACGKIAWQNPHLRDSMTASKLLASVLTVAYFAAAGIGFRRKLLSRAEAGLLIAIGVIGAIIVWLLVKAA